MSIRHRCWGPWLRLATVAGDGFPGDVAQFHSASPGASAGVAAGSVSQSSRVVAAIEARIAKMEGRLAVRRVVSTSERVPLRPPRTLLARRHRRRHHHLCPMRVGIVTWLHPVQQARSLHQRAMSTIISITSTGMSARQSEKSKCYKLFDFGVLETWKKAKKELCMPGSDPDDSALTCRVMRHPRLNAPTAPHTICDGRNVF